MTDSQRNDAYGIAVNQGELDRLVAIARLYNPFVLDAYRRTDIGPGGKVIDIGCGALGGLLALADLVGPEGTVMGLDMDATSLGRARAILDQQGHEYVQLIQGNINEIDPAAFGAAVPFDSAFCRLFLAHQPDPASTLRRMAALVRPGGSIVAHEILPMTHPSIPEVPALDAATDLWMRTVRARGASGGDAGLRLATLCAEAGLHIVDQHGWFMNMADNPALGIGLVRATTIGFRTAILETGTATVAEFDALLAELTAAEQQRYDVLAGPTFMQVVAQVPEAVA